MDVFRYMFLCSSLQILCCFAEDFHPERTRLMDFYPRDAPRNFLFRGNMPISNNTFAYDILVGTMNSSASKNNVSLPKDFVILDVSYLNVFEETDMKIERDFFKSNPDKGMFHNRMIVGTVIPPPQNDTKLLNDSIETYVTLSLDNLPNLMEYLRSTLTHVSNTSLIIYTHCEAGTDRTGEVSGAYYMRYLNMTFTQALEVDNHIQNRDMYKMSRNAMQWYCFYLRLRIGMKSVGGCLV